MDLVAREELQAFLTQNKMEEVALRIEVDPTDSVSETMDSIMKAITNLLAQEGMEFPVHLAMLACNGSGNLSRYTLRPNGNGADVKLLAEHNEAPGWLLPMHALLMDSAGYTARVILTPKRKGN
jgi:hypothetical protein